MNEHATKDLLGIGELIVEIMRPTVGVPLHMAGQFVGPYPSGAPAITISAAAQAGLRCGFVGSVGEDDFGRCLLDRLTSDGVDLASVAVSAGKTTGCAFVTYFEDGSRKFIFHFANTASDCLEPSAGLEGYARQFRHLHLMGCSLTISTAMREACMCAARSIKAAGGSISFDPNLRPELVNSGRSRAWLDPLLDMTDLLLPSGAEARMLTGAPTDEAACTNLLERGISIVAQKLGAAGCRVWLPSRHFDVPGFPIEAIDPTGAGDCFDAGFITAWLEGQSLENAALLANAMGALGASRQGPMSGVFPRAEIEAFMHSHANTTQGALE